MILHAWNRELRRVLISLWIQQLTRSAIKNDTAETTDSTPANGDQVPAASQSEPQEPVRFKALIPDASVDNILDGFQMLVTI